jgi:hypothetical protein
MARFDAGSFKATGSIELGGAYTSPLKIGALRIWRDTNGDLRCKDGSDPGSATDGTLLQEANGGTTAQRPASPNTFWMYFDTTIGKPIWWNGTNWKDATGATV